MTETEKQPPHLTERWIQNLAGALSISLMVFVFALTMWVHYQFKTKSLGDIDFVRGVLTLIFVAMTVGLAVVVMFHAVFLSSADAEDRRFTRGREVLGIFSGVLATIIGFYFGASDKSAAAGMSIYVRLEGQTGVARIVGGTAPYNVTLTANDKKLGETPSVSADGWFINDRMPADTKSVTLDVIDSKNARASGSASKPKATGGVNDTKPVTKPEMPSISPASSLASPGNP